MPQDLLPLWALGDIPPADVGVAGAPISLHFDFGADASIVHRALDTLEWEGVNLARVIVGHMGVSCGAPLTLADHADFARRGAYIEFDGLAFDGCMTNSAYVDETAHFQALADQGFAERILVCGDLLNHALIQQYGYEFTLTTIRPNLRLDPLILDMVFAQNPQRVLPFLRA